MDLSLEARLRRLQDDFDASFEDGVEKGAEHSFKHHLSVQVGPENFAVPISKVRRLVCDVDVVPLPGAPAHLMGIINLRGEVITVYDLPGIFGYRLDPGAHNNVVVMKGLSFEAGLAVSDIGKLVELDPDPAGASPSSVPNHLRQVVRGTTYRDNRLYLFPDFTQLFIQLDARY